MSRGNGAERGRLAVQRLRDEIAAREAAGTTLPMNGRALHLANICRLLGVGRSTVTQNPAFRALLVDYAAGKGVAFSARGSPRSAAGLPDAAAGGPSAGSGEDGGMVPLSRLREEQRRVAALERRLGELVARNASLVARLRRHEATDQALIAAGRRYRPGPPDKENPGDGQASLEADGTPAEGESE
ncbi:MAG: hypothetical protein OXQ93_00470 [Gemmatimonadota bacterium]|nr:hypothetical protein [Gemmatimonadota bacterium]